MPLLVSRSNPGLPDLTQFNNALQHMTHSIIYARKNTKPKANQIINSVHLNQLSIPLVK